MLTSVCVTSVPWQLNMQENNNFQRIISQWRRLSGEQVESSALLSMSGDSHHSDKKEDNNEKDLLVPDRIPGIIAGAGAAAATVEPAVIPVQLEEKQQLIESVKNEESKVPVPGDAVVLGGSTAELEEKKKLIDISNDSEESKVPVSNKASGVVGPAVVNTQPEDKQKLIEPANKEESKESSGDSRKDDRSDSLSKHKSLDQTSEDKEERGDKLDSVYLRPPLPEKMSSNTPTPPEEEEDCGMKCLYYTLMCCDCVLM